MLVSIFRSLLNEVHIDYNEYKLTVSEGPIKWFGLGKVTIDSNKIDHFFTKKGNSKNIAEQNVGRNMAVYAKLRNGRSTAVIKQVGIDNAEFLVNCFKRN